MISQQKKPVTRKQCPIAKGLAATRHRNALRLRIYHLSKLAPAHAEEVDKALKELAQEEAALQEQLTSSRRYWRKLTQARREGWFG